ncbi:MAG: SMP-30/gluconolactonase/LRE family protein [Candidatus Binatia bacterium]
MKLDTNVLLDGLVFPEGPRWREGKLWFSDMHANAVMTVDLEGRAERILEVAGKPSGLGWLPDGRLLVVSMTDRRLLRRDRTGLAELADLSALASCHLNDMVVDADGRAYVGNFGFDLFQNAPPKDAELILVTPDGRSSVVADGLSFPNGSVITPDGRTLVVAESFAARLTAFDRESDGALSNRRVWAQLEEGVTPDGICLDAEGAIWTTSPLTGELLRVREGGEITHRLRPPHPPYACMLGGADRRTLFLATADTHEPEEAKTKRSGRIETARVDVPGAGLP